MMGHSGKGFSGEESKLWSQENIGTLAVQSDLCDMFEDLAFCQHTAWAAHVETRVVYTGSSTAQTGH